MAAARRSAQAAQARVHRADDRAGPYEMIKRGILQGELQAGQQLVETSLAEWCEVSRTPIREALRRLEQDGLVYRSDRGMVVRKRSPEEILDIYEVRIVLEATAAKIAAERRTEHEIRLLRSMLQQCDDVPADDPTAMAEANRVFHETVWRASHNESLIDLLQRLGLHLGRYPETTLAHGDRWQVARHEHTEIVDAIERRDGAAGYELALKHFTEARDIRLTIYDKQALAGLMQPSSSSIR